MEISITWNICRVCLQEEQKNTKNCSGGGQQMKLIFSDNSQIAQQIYECSGISMKPNDSLPEKICRKCFSILKYAVNFRKTCNDSDKYLQSILQRTKSASILFKPERSTYLENEMTDDPFSNDDEDETEVTKLEDAEVEFQNIETPKSKPNNCLTKQSKQLKSIDATKPSGIGITKGEDTEGDHVVVAHEQIIENESKDELEEEIVENPEDMMKQLFSNVTEENLPPTVSIIEEEEEEVEETEDNESSKKDLKHKAFPLEEFYANDGYTKLPNDHLLSKIIVEDHDDITEEAQESDDLYYLLKDIKNKNPANTDRFPPYEDSHQNEEHIVETDDHDRDEKVDNDTDVNVDFIAIDEEEDLDDQDISIIMHLEDEVEDNQSQVTSTVVTKDDDFNENSNLSTGTNDLTYEYIIDDYAIEETQSNNSSQSSNAKPRKILTNSNKKISQAILRGRKRNTNTASSSTGSQVFVCDLCGNHFTNRQLMNAHMKVHRQEKNHECEICFKRFITACNLQAHMRVHTGEKPFECQYCGRRFNDRSSNLRHERTHTNEKPFHCDICGKTFALATTLQAHLKVHTGERSYRCEPCAKSFKLPHQLKAHRNTTLHKAVEQMGKCKN